MRASSLKSIRAPCRFLRIAFDIGSGATKVCGAICHRENDDGKVVLERVLFEKEQVLMIGQAVKHGSADGKTIPEHTIEEIHTTLGSLIRHVYAALEEYNENPNVGPGSKIRLKNVGLSAPRDGNTVAEENDGAIVRAGSEQRVGIATAIFRSATNGAAVLASLRSSPALRLRCTILSQDEEAAIGYETAKQHALLVPELKQALSDKARIVSYDSGAASFQLTTAMAGEGKEERVGGCDQQSADRTSRHTLAFFNGQWGSTIAHLALLKIVAAEREERRQKNPDAPATTTFHELDPNPVGQSAANKFVKQVLDDLNHNARHPQSATEIFRDIFRNARQIRPEALKRHQHKEKQESAKGLGRVFVQSFGGDTCAFMMASLVFGGASYFEREALWEKINAVYCHKTIQEITALGFVQPEMLLPKLLLVYAVMKHLGIDGLHYQRAIGNTRALICTDKYWQKPQEPEACPSLTPKL